MKKFFAYLFPIPAVLALDPVLAFAQGSPEFCGFGNGAGWGFGIFGGIITLVVWILIIVGVIYLIRGLIHGPRGHYYGGQGYGWKTEGRYKEILKERYAKGEITKDEYDKMMDEINKI